jgi:hypothetical protein
MSDAGRRRWLALIAVAALIEESGSIFRRC